MKPMKRAEGEWTETELREASRIVRAVCDVPLERRFDVAALAVKCLVETDLFYQEPKDYLSLGRKLR